MTNIREQFETIENDDAERYEFHSKTNDSVSYLVDYAECFGSLSLACQIVEKSKALEAER